MKRQCKGNDEKLLGKIQQRGGRMTSGRRVLFEVFRSECRPLSFHDIEQLLKTDRLDRATIYRNLSFFESLGFICRVLFPDGVRWEWSDLDNHHHHVVCMSCDRTEMIRFPKTMERAIESAGREKQFVLTGHSLELFGICSSCRKS